MPVYLLIRNDHIEIRDARRLWGMDTWETQQTIRREQGDERMRVICIGPAGENLVHRACLITGRKDAAGGIGGLGTVMGSKKLKAIAVRGSKDITVAHPMELLDYFKEQTDLLMTRKWIKALGRLGTAVIARQSTLRDWGSAADEKPAEGGTGPYAEDILPYSLGMAACAGCAVHCRHRHLVSEGPYAGPPGEGPELASLGVSQNNNIETVLYINDLVNILGLTVLAGGDVSWATTLYEKGIIDDKTVGYPLKRGDVATRERLLKDMAYRRGFGDILADGR